MNATFKYNEDRTAIIIDCPRRLSHQVAKIPGAYCRNDEWTIPPSYQHFAMATHLLPGYSVGDTDLRQNIVRWSEKYENIRKLTQTRPEKRNGSLSHQVAMEDWVDHLDQNLYPGGLITAGTGTGKTRTMVLSINEMLDRNPSGRHLIVCPNGLRQNWVEEFERWAPHIRVGFVGGTAAQRRKILDRDYDVYVISYKSAIAHTRLAAYGGIKLSDKDKKVGELNVPWHSVILDEAHRLKDPTTKTARACWKIGETARIRFALTATPVSNDVGDIWSLIRFIDSDLFPSRGKYLELFADLHDNPFGYTEIKGFKKDNYELFKLIFGPMHFHVDPDEALDLPPVTRKIHYVQMPPKLKKQYNLLESKKTLQVEDMPPIPVAESIVRQTRLQQIAQGSVLHMDDDGELFMDEKNVKVDALMDILDSIPPDEKVVVFSESKDLLHLAAHAITKADNGKDDRVGSIITGDVPTLDRVNLIADFQQNPKHVYMLATMATMAEGHTLTAANHCVFIQRSYSLVSNQQAEGRLRRIGQEAEVIHIHDIVMEDTVDENPARAVATKAGRLEEVLETGKAR